MNEDYDYAFSHFENSLNDLIAHCQDLKLPPGDMAQLCFIALVKLDLDFKEELDHFNGLMREYLKRIDATAAH